MRSQLELNQIETTRREEMVETRKVSFRELGLTVSPGREVWGPKRITNQEYAAKCEEILAAESKRKPGHRVHMTLDHSSRSVTFSYVPIDYALEERYRLAESIVWKAKM